MRRIAQEQVQGRSEDRREPGEADPADRHAHPALAQQGMHGHRDREGEADQGLDIRPQERRRIQPTKENLIHLHPEQDTDVRPI